MSLSGLRTWIRSSSGAGGGRSSEESSPMSMPSSPSFSDFSCSVQADLEADRKAPEPANPFDQFQSLHRGSLDTARAHMDAPYTTGGSSSLWGRLSMDAGSPRASGSPRGGRPLLSTASMASPGAAPSFHPRHSPAMSIPQLRPVSATAPAQDASFAQTCPSGDAAEAAHRRGGGRPEGKIDGMDYYGWCELLRSSSL